MRLLLAALAAMLVPPRALHAQDYGQWHFHYEQAVQAGQLSSCNASIDYPNAFLSARLFGNEMDFLYHRDDFTLPYGQELGSVIFRVDGRAFLLEAFTSWQWPDQMQPTAQQVYFAVAGEDQGALLKALRNGDRLWIEFPNGDRDEFPLEAGGNAFRLAADCWNTQPTGPFFNNPFDLDTAGRHPSAVL